MISALYLSFFAKLSSIQRSFSLVLLNLQTLKNQLNSTLFGSLHQLQIDFHSILVTVRRTSFYVITRHPRVKRSRLPIELTSIICKYLAQNDGKSTLAVMMRLSSDAYDIAARGLYEKVTLSTENADSFFLGLAIATSSESDGKQPVGPSKTGDFKRDDAGKSPLLAWCSEPDIPCRLQWPDTDCDSDDLAPFTSLQPAYLQHATKGYPTARSHSRKLQLLHHVHHVTITSLFNFDLIVRTRPVINFLNRRHRKQTHLMSNVVSHSFGPGIFVETADWENRRRQNKTTRHPFCDMIRDIFSPRNICVDSTLTIDKAEYFRRRNRHNMERTLGNAILKTKSGSILGSNGEDYIHHRERAFDEEWASFCELKWQASFASVTCNYRRLQSITYHNADGGGPVLRENVLHRLYFRGNSCLGISTNTAVNEPRLQLSQQIVRPILEDHRLFKSTQGRSSDTESEEGLKWPEYQFVLPTLEHKGASQPFDTNCLLKSIALVRKQKRPIHWIPEFAERLVVTAAEGWPVCVCCGKT